MSALHAVPRPSRRTLRVLAVVLVLASASPAMATVLGVATGSAEYDGGVPDAVPPADGHTVVTVDGIGPGLIAAYAPNGSKVYEADDHRFYHDVDPAPRFGKATVTYVASHAAFPRHCASDDGCRKSQVMRLNVTTGEREELWARYATPSGSNNIHDVDFVNDTHLVVAEISHPDGVYVVNVSADEEVWRWNASEHYAPNASGGQYPGDWTHMNDVEYLHDRGLVMASPRNMDSVIFLRPGEGVVENMTLGSDGDHRTLYEAHNPDFIPAERGGPAVLVADSENDRVVEYQRVDGSWERSWLWRDGRVQWPRDADRLPNDHTLVTDTHSDRVVEVDEAGDVVWQMRFPGPYEAERLGTGEESAGGVAAAESGIDSRRASGGVLGGVALAAEDALPSLLVNGMLFTLPRWMNPVDAVGMVFAALFAVAWGVGELGLVARRRVGEDSATTGDADGSTPGDD
ncbi:hypothetical protein [Halorubellus sp. PRR65]|uniref:hypothetical protein n=1 Tax=Halorubellus sp. PRR65 TaxID=3098148 RepID=UPI002B25C98F|nr:hypothetical protein [Halorubellus sp. PRR65]